MEKRREAEIHFLMSAIGGYIGIYCIFERNGIFALAQTLNLIYVVTGIGNGNWKDVGIRLGGAGMASAAIVTSVFLLRYGENRRKKFSIAITAIAVFAEGFIPSAISPVIALYPIFFAMTLQWCAFCVTYGYGSSTIFSTNNLRQCVEGYAQYFMGKNQKMLNKARFFRNALVSYHIGAAVCFFVIDAVGGKGIWCCLLVLAVAWKKC